MDTPADALLFAIAETLECMRKRPDLCDQAAWLERFSSARVAPLRECARIMQRDTFRLGFVGLTNAGKSTLISAILGEKLAPSGNGPTTSTRVEYRYADTFGLKTIPADPAQPIQNRVFNTPGDLLAEVRRMAACASAQKSYSGNKLVVQCPCPLLKHGLSLVDTEGVGAASADCQEAGQGALASFLQDLKNKTDAFVFCVPAGVTLKVTPVETQLYSALKERILTLLVTKSEEDAEGEAAWVRQYGHLFESHEPLFVNARKGLNISAVRAFLAAFSTPQKRRAFEAGRVASLLGQCEEHFVEIFGFPLPWAPLVRKRVEAACDHAKRPQG